MRETKIATQQAHFQMRKQMYESVRSRAVKEDKSMSDLMRGYVKQGLAIHNFMDKGGTVVLHYPDGTERIMRR